MNSNNQFYTAPEKSGVWRELDPSELWQDVSMPPAPAATIVHDSPELTLQEVEDLNALNNFDWGSEIVPINYDMPVTAPNTPASRRRLEFNQPQLGGQPIPVVQKRRRRRRKTKNKNTSKMNKLKKVVEAVGAKTVVVVML